MVSQKDKEDKEAKLDQQIRKLEAEVVRWKSLAEGQAVQSGQQDDHSGEVAPIGRRKRSESGGHSPEASSGPVSRICCFTPSDGFQEPWDHVKAPLLLKFAGDQSFVLLPRQLQELTPAIVAQIQVRCLPCAKLYK
jgi:hypothetical protein